MILNYQNKSMAKINPAQMTKLKDSTRAKYDQAFQICQFLKKNSQQTEKAKRNIGLQQQPLIVKTFHEIETGSQNSLIQKLSQLLYKLRSLKRQVMQINCANTSKKVTAHCQFSKQVRPVQNHQEIFANSLKNFQGRLKLERKKLQQLKGKQKEIVKQQLYIRQYQHSLNLNRQRAELLIRQNNKKKVMKARKQNQKLSQFNKKLKQKLKQKKLSYRKESKTQLLIQTSPEKAPQNQKFFQTEIRQKEIVSKKLVDKIFTSKTINSIFKQVKQKNNINATKKQIQYRSSQISIEQAPKINKLQIRQKLQNNFIQATIKRLLSRQHSHKQPLNLQKKNEVSQKKQKPYDQMVQRFYSPITRKRIVKDNQSLKKNFILKRTSQIKHRNQTKKSIQRENYQMCKIELQQKHQQILQKQMKERQRLKKYRQKVSQIKGQIMAVRLQANHIRQSKQKFISLFQKMPTQALKEKYRYFYNQQFQLKNRSDLPALNQKEGVMNNY